MPPAAVNKRPKRGRRSVHLDPDMVAWVAQRARAGSTSEATIIRQAIRAAMEAEQQQRQQDADGEAAG